MMGPHLDKKRENGGGVLTPFDQEGMMMNLFVVVTCLAVPSVAFTPLPADSSNLFTPATTSQVS
jgi:hypothetical protein